MSVDFGAAVSGAVVRAQWVGEGAAGWAEEGRREGTGGSLGPSCVAGFEVEGAFACHGLCFVWDRRCEADLGVTGALVAEGTCEGEQWEATERFEARSERYWAEG